MKEIPEKVYQVLSQRFNILEHLSFWEFDHDFDVLKNRLIGCQKSVFHHDDRIIIEHQDTDYYFDQCSVGVNLRNFFLVVEELDIPRYIFVFYTNHFGINKEIESLCQHYDPMDRPTIIESFLSNLVYDSAKIKDVELDTGNITHHALCMMNLIRSHRSAMYHALKHIPPDVLALNVTVPNLTDATE